MSSGRLRLKCITDVLPGRGRLSLFSGRATRAFNRIKAGLDDAVAHARGEPGRGRVRVAPGDLDARYARLLARRVEHFLFTEHDWATGEPYGTAIPLLALDAEPPGDEDEEQLLAWLIAQEAEPPGDEDEEQLLAWLIAQEAEHRGEIDAAWKVIFGGAFPAGR